MARPPVITDEQIITAAREVFLTHGFGATTAEVARRAGVAEGTIFNRFKTKVDLFRAAMRPELDDPSIVGLIQARAGRGDVRENLLAIAVAAVEFLRPILPLIMMSWSNPGPGGVPSILAGPAPLPLRVLGALREHVAREIAAGRMGKHDPDAVARVFMGSIQSFVVLETLSRARAEATLAAEPYLRSVVDILWRGIAPKRGPSRCTCSA